MCLYLASTTPHFFFKCPFCFVSSIARGKEMQILECESAAVTHNKVLYQSASEVASWKIDGKRI